MSNSKQVAPQVAVAQSRSLSMCDEIVVRKVIQQAIDDAGMPAVLRAVFAEPQLRRTLSDLGLDPLELLHHILNSRSLDSRDAA